MSKKIYVGSEKVFDPADYDAAGAAAAAEAAAKAASDPVGSAATAQANAEAASDPAGTAAGLVGTLASLLTTAKTNIVAAVNEVIGYIGTLASLTTTAKTSTVAAINELDADVGNLASLTTTAKTSAVAAINELDSELASIGQSWAGTLDSEGWTGEAAPYVQDVTAVGMTSDRIPIVDIDLSGCADHAAELTMIEDFALLYRIVSGAEKITVYATAEPSADIGLTIRAVK